MKLSKIFLTTVLAMAFAINLSAQDKKVFKYVGSKSCKMCHTTKKQGQMYKIWQKSKHAQAYEVLASEKALAIAKERGIENPQKSGECLQCHVTAYGVEAERLGPKFKIEEGVGCEACHGPGSAYKPKKVMKAITAGKIDPASVGLVKPTEETCKKCHNEKSPTFKGFDFEEMYKKIEHKKPAASKS